LRTPKFRTIAVAMGVALLAAAAIAQAEVEQKGTIRVTFDGKLTPKTLPRTGVAPVKVSVGAKIAPTSPTAEAPQLTKMSIAINKYGVIDSTGLPACQLDDIQPSTTADALAVCKRSLVGEGTFSANVPASGRSPFPSSGKLYAFSGQLNGKPAILAHVYGVRPAPTSFTLAFLLGHSGGKFGTTMTVALPKATSGGYITGITLDLFKTFSFKGKKRSFISATCPAPKGVNVAGFAFAKASFSFVGGQKINSTLNRSCTARGK
jgi:hypothetical protein